MSGLIWLLLIVLVIAAIVAKIKRSARIVVFRTDETGHIRADDSRRVSGLRGSNVEQMVSCAQCGIYFPASEAVFRGGKVYCCEDHAPR